MSEDIANVGVTDRLALGRKRKRSGADQVDDSLGEVGNALIVEHFRTGPNEIGSSERPNARHVGNLIVSSGRSAQDSRAECVNAKLTKHKRRNLRIAFVGFNEYVWKIG